MLNVISKFDHDAIRIVRVDHWLVRMPLAETILWGSGKRSGTTRLICRIQTRDGGIGWGETISLIDNVPAVFAKIVAPLAAGYSIADAEHFHLRQAGHLQEPQYKAPDPHWGEHLREPPPRGQLW